MKQIVYPRPETVPGTDIPNTHGQTCYCKLCLTDKMLAESEAMMNVVGAHLNTWKVSLADAKTSGKPPFADLKRLRDNCTKTIALLKENHSEVMTGKMAMCAEFELSEPPHPNDEPPTHPRWS